LELQGKRVLMRVDYNVPIEEKDGQMVINDATRIKETLPTLELLVKKGAKIILTAHLGRPDGKRESSMSLRPVAQKLSERLGPAVASREYLRWVQASVGSNLRMIPTSDVLFFHAEDKYTRVQTARFDALIRKPIKELIEELDPEEFWQIHRATVVRVDAIEQVSRNIRGNQLLHLRGTDEKLEVSRSFNHLFKQM
jgi:3-phosphoglycerate kinase